MHGCAPIREQRRSDEHLPVLSTWGYNVPVVIAEARFVTRTGRWSNTCM